MSIGAIASTHTTPTASTAQAAPRVAPGRDNDGDEAGESATKQSQEAAAKTQSLPVNPAKGRNLNILA